MKEQDDFICYANAGVIWKLDQKERINYFSKQTHFNRASAILDCNLGEAWEEKEEKSPLGCGNEAV